MELGFHAVFGGYREIFSALENTDINFPETFREIFNINIVPVSSASNTVKIDLDSLHILLQVVGEYFFRGKINLKSW